MGKIKFRPLQVGDTVALIAPARAVSEAEMAPFLEWARNKGWKVQTGKHVFGRQHQFSGTDAERAADFIEAWTDPGIKAVFTARGGYGCMRWLHLVDESVWAKGEGKILVGFSDITTLHLALHRRGFESLHGPMAFNLFAGKPETPENFEKLHQALCGEAITLDLSQNKSLNPGPFSGELIGGNLSILFASLGTPERPDTDGKILFLEDLDEYVYHIDRMIVSLGRAGLLQNLNGLLVGQMLEMKDNTIPFGMTVEESIAYHTEKYGFPVIFGLPVGHGAENYCLKLNAYTTFDGSFLKQPS